MFARHITFVVTGLLLAATSAFADAPKHRPMGINAREDRQAVRIEASVKDGEITRGELDRLRGDEAAIRAEERVYRQSGNGLNGAERRDLERDLNKTSREIYRARHNQRKPN